MLEWRNATSDDREALRTFECTVRVKRQGRTRYPRAWERDVEAAVRTVNPRCDQRSAVLLGIDDAGVGAVVSVGWRAGDQAWMVELVAIANRLRRMGGATADEALEEAIQWAINRADAAGQLSDFVMIADFDSRNAASRWLLQRHGFTHLVRHDSHEVWALDQGALPLEVYPSP